MAGVQGYNYNYDYLGERTGRVTYAQNIYDSTLDRSYQYDQVGRLAISHSGAEARAHAFTGQWGTTDGPYSHGYEYDVWGNMTHRYGWGGEVQGGSAGQTSHMYTSFTNNRRNGFSYDAAGNLTNDLGQTFTYDATGQQATASYMSVQQSYDGDGLRVKKTENGATRYYLRSAVLGGQVVAETDAGGTWMRGYVYQGGTLLAVQAGGVNWMHDDPVTKSKRVTDSLGNVISSIEMDPWGADTNRSSNAAFQPKKFTSYHRDDNGSDEAMFRRYNRWHSRFDQPDPYDGSYDLTDPQSFNRYAYVGNDPVNFVDPSGLRPNFFCEVSGNAETGFSTYCVVNGWDRWGGFEPKQGGGGGGGGVGPQKPAPQKPKQDLQALFDKVRKDCLAREKAKADRARTEYYNRYASRLFWSMGTGALVGAVRGGYVGAVGGEVLEPLGGGVPGAIVGGVVGGIFGAAGGVFTSVVKEPLYRAWYNRHTYNPAVNRSYLDCDAEARTAVATAQMGGRR